ncbi:MAG: stage V sporulation protein SpoVM [Clostridia bacterium]|nr:stage V sporulation protein SpoVM [Clostridia bacterium]MBR3818678.1 stage V sporulation protein SpoVM [Clostridia bacterium]
MPILTERGGLSMKIVVVRSPKIFNGILRMIFGIKKQDVV